MNRELLDTEVLEKALAGLEEWRLDAGGKSISRKFTFRNFSEAFAFMTRIALLAEKMDHHPDWRNVYRTVEISLSTHDQDGITALDIRMAEGINRLATA